MSITITMLKCQCCGGALHLHDINQEFVCCVYCDTLYNVSRNNQGYPPQLIVAKEAPAREKLSNIKREAFDSFLAMAYENISLLDEVYVPITPAYSRFFMTTVGGRLYIAEVVAHIHLFSCNLVKENGFYYVKTRYLRSQIVDTREDIKDILSVEPSYRIEMKTSGRLTFYGGTDSFEAKIRSRDIPEWQKDIEKIKKMIVSS